MRHLIRLAVVLLCCACNPAASFAQGGVVIGAVTGMTIGGLLSGLREVVQQMEQSARTLIDQGNNALAQQQLIFAGILKGIIDKAANAYADSLHKTFEEALGPEEQSAFRNAFEIIAQTKAMVLAGGQEAQSAIYKTQGAANQLLTRIPLSATFPIFYGAQVKGAVTTRDQSPSDIEIFGFMFTDRHLDGKRPVVAVAGREVESKYVSVQEDRIQIQLPDDIKTKINLKGGPCSPRQTFPIALTVFYAQKRGFWPVNWHTEHKIDFNANAIAEKIKFEYRISYDGVRSAQTLVPQSFAVQSGSVSAGCTETANANAVFNAPDGSVELNCSASWVSASNVKGSTQNCVPSGTTATAVGSITGKDRECVVRDVISWASGGIFGGLVSRVIGKETLCNCPGGASAALLVSGTYKTPTTISTRISGEGLGSYVRNEGLAADISLPFDAAVSKKRVKVEVRRQNCEQLVDTIELNVGVTPNLVIDQTSQKGLFKATLRNDQLTISESR